MVDRRLLLYYAEQRRKTWRKLDEMGFSTIPLVRGSKEPALVKWKPYQTKKVDKITFEKWLNPKKDYNFGVLTGTINSIGVIDVDRKGWVKDVEKIITPTPWATDSINGAHFYYCLGNNQHLQKRTKVLMADGATKADVIGEGAYIVGPYSLHPADHLWEGSDYKKLPDWIKTKWALKNLLFYLPRFEWEFEDGLPLFQENWIFEVEKSNVNLEKKKSFRNWILKANYESKYSAAVKYIKKMDGAIANVNGNNKTLQAACVCIKKFLLTDSDSHNILVKHFNPKCEPPWDPKDLWKYIHDANEYGRDENV